MLGLSELKQTKVYQEALEEGEQKAKLEAVPELLVSRGQKALPWSQCQAEAIPGLTLNNIASKT